MGCCVQAALKSLSVSLGSSDTRFSAALGADKRISVTGTVKSGAPYLTRIGTFDMDLSLAGIILLVSNSSHRLGLLSLWPNLTIEPACISPDVTYESGVTQH